MKLILVFISLLLLATASFAGYAGSPNDTAAPAYRPNYDYGYGYQYGYGYYPQVRNYHWSCYVGRGRYARLVGVVNGINYQAALSNCYVLINGGYPFDAFYNVYIR